MLSSYRGNSAATAPSASGKPILVAFTGGSVVASVGLALPVSVFTISGSPVTTTGTLTGTFNTQSANLVWAGPASGAAAVPTFRALVDDDIPGSLTITGGTINNAAIGGSTPAAGAFTTLSATGLLDISAAGAGQVKFPAAQNASADANTLDDYEEGTWTAVDNSGAGLGISGSNSHYTKIGNSVIVTSRFDYPATVDGSNASIGGLPFTPGTDGHNSGYISYSNVAVLRYGLTGTSSVTVAFYTSAGAAVTNAQMSASVNYFGATYLI